MDLTDLQAIVALGRHGSFTGAARALGVVRSTLARRVATLEEALGVKVILTHPEGVTLTHRGRLLAEEAEDILASTARLEARVRAVSEAPRGVVRLVYQVGLHPALLSSGLASLTSTYPELSFQVRASERPATLLQDWGDVGLAVGRLPEASRLNARVLTRVAFGLVASPSYLERHGTPETPEALAEHDVVCWAEPGGEGVLPMRDGGVLQVAALVSTPDFHVARLWALAGTAIAYAPVLPALPGVDDGPLHTVLGDQVGEDVAVWLLVRRGLSRTPRVQALLVEALEMAGAYGGATPEAPT